MNNIVAQNKSTSDSNSGNTTNNDTASFKKTTTRSPGSIIGLPPQFEFEPQSKNELYTIASMPICRIYPAVASASGQDSEGLHIYSLNTNAGIAKWADILKTTNLGITNPGSYLDIAYLHETSISETFSNEYGNSKFEEFGNMGSGAISELRQITGSKTAQEAFGKIGKELGNIPAIGGLLQTGASIGAGATGIVEKGLKSTGLGLEKLLSGSRVDFPQIWKNSSYQSNYSITCRLYNPAPNSLKLYRERILIPMAKVLSFVIPQSDKEAITYYVPLLCKVKCPGLWEIRGGFISSVEVIKGGEANDVSFKQRPGVVDLRISFGELYGVVTTSTGIDNSYADRPTLGRYLNILNQSALGEGLDFTASPDDDFSTNSTSNSIPYSQNSNKLGSTVLANSRISIDKLNVVKQLGDKLKNPSILSNIETLKGYGSTLSNKLSNSAIASVGDSNVSKLILAGVGLGVNSVIESNLDTMVTDAETNSILGKLNTQVGEDSAKSLARACVSISNSSIMLNGNEALANHLLNISDIEGGIVTTEITNINTTLTGMNPTISKNTGTNLSSSISGINSGLIAQALSEGRLGKTGKVPIDLVKVSLVDNNSLKNNISDISQADGGSNTALIELVQMIMKLLTGFEATRSSNPGELLGLSPSPTTGLRDTDVTQPDTLLVDGGVSDLNANLMIDSSNSFKSVVNTVGNNYANDLISLIKAKQQYDESPATDELYSNLESQRSLFVITSNKVSSGFYGDIVKSNSLNEILELMNGNLSESQSSGLMDAVADTYVEKSNAMGGLVVSLGLVLIAASGADASVKAGIQANIDAATDAQTDFSDMATTLRANATAIEIEI